MTERSGPESADLVVVDGLSAGAWIEPRLGGEFGAVTLQVPKGYEAYARVFHPVLDSDWNPMRWAEVAEKIGTTAHREMQWHAILGLASADELRGSREPGTAVGDRWAGHNPLTGVMTDETVDALCGVLASHTADPDDCYFGLCVILGWEESFSPSELKPLLKLPWGRDHIVLRGSLAAVDQIAEDWSKPSSSRAIITFHGSGEAPSELDPADLVSRQAPNLIWPADRSWFVVSEVDFDSTLVGGSAELVEAIVESSELEAWQLEPTDSLAADADKVNRVLDRDG